jgi:rhamnulokinase
LAVDLGAGSGRVVAGIYDGARLELKEINRFANDPVKKDDGWHWQLESLMAGIQEGIGAAVREYGDEVVTLGVDTWGVDYGLIDAEGNLLAAPFQYRDTRTDGMMEEAYRRMPKAEIYQRTGIQFMFFNTIYQLLAEAHSSAQRLEKADRLLFMPDLINYFLTGRKTIERSIASTSQLLDARTQNWDRDLLKAMGLPERIFGELIDAGEVLGELKPELARTLGNTRLKVIAPGSHDTASAVVGVPAEDEEPVFLSSGTWSLIGRELKKPVITDASFQVSFSNEGGVQGTTRFLKNIAGMWLLQECKRTWDAAGSSLSFGDLVTEAEKAEPFRSLIDPDVAEFQAPENMPEAIAEYCRKTGQPVPQTPGQFTRAILESLALKYRKMKELLEALTGQRVEKIHIVGGGSQNRLLNRFAADATGCQIVAGPVEATSAGNIVMQLIALGQLKSLSEGRALIRRSFATEEYFPENTAAWAEAARRQKF